MQRTVEVNIGDWSDDGHGKCDKLRIVIAGVDISDFALQRSYEKSKEEFGIDIFNCFKDYGNCSLDEALFKKFVKAGYPEKLKTTPYYHVQAGDIEFDGLELLLWFIGRNISCFRWKPADPVPVLVGGFGSIITGTIPGSTSYGYGFFH